MDTDQLTLISYLSSHIDWRIIVTYLLFGDLKVCCTYVYVYGEKEWLRPPYLFENLLTVIFGCHLFR